MLLTALTPLVISFLSILPTVCEQHNGHFRLMERRPCSWRDHREIPDTGAASDSGSSVSTYVVTLCPFAMLRTRCCCNRQIVLSLVRPYLSLRRLRYRRHRVLRSFRGAASHYSFDRSRHHRRV